MIKKINDSSMMDQGVCYKETIIEKINEIIQVINLLKVEVSTLLSEKDNMSKTDNNIMRDITYY